MIETDKFAGDRLIAPQTESAQEDALERAAPKPLADYTGQRKSANNWKSSSRQRGSGAIRWTTCCSSVPRLGKTTLPTSSPPKWASICARPPARFWSAPATCRHPHQPGTHDVLFIDEIHRLSPVVEKKSSTRPGRFQIDIMIGEGAPAARSVKLDLPPFHPGRRHHSPGMLTNPCATASASSPAWSSIPPPNCDIVTRSARCSTPLSTPKAPWKSPPLARHARIANRLLRRVRDYAEVKADGSITPYRRRCGAGHARRRPGRPRHHGPQAPAAVIDKVRRRPGEWTIWPQPSAKPATPSRMS